MIEESYYYYFTYVNLLTEPTEQLWHYIKVLSGNIHSIVSKCGDHFDKRYQVVRSRGSAEATNLVRGIADQKYDDRLKTFRIGSFGEWKIKK